MVNELIGLLAGLGPLTVQNQTVDFISCQKNLTAETAAV